MGQSTGTIQVVAGTGNPPIVPGAIGDGGLAKNAFLDGPESVVVDALGNLYIREKARVRKVNPAGIITTVAGNGTNGSSGDGGPATNAQLGLGPQRAGLAVDSAGNLYIADTNNQKVRKVDASGTITTVAGNGQVGLGSGDGSKATSVALCFPSGVAMDQAGNLYIGSSVCGGVRKVDPPGTITTVARNSAGPSYGVALDVNGILYLNAGGVPSQIRKVNANGSIAIVAGTGTGTAYNGDGRPATSANLFEVDGVAIDPAGNVYITDSGNGRIRKVDTSGIITTVAGHGSTGPGAGCQNLFTTGCPATNLKFSGSDVALDASGNLYTANFIDGLVYEVSGLNAGTGCTFGLNLGGQTFSPAGGNGTVNITTNPGCAWSVANIPSWVIVTGGSAGTGNGSVSYQVVANSGGDRSGSLTIAGQSFTVEQTASSIPGLAAAGSLGQVTSQGTWLFSLNAINLGNSTATARITFTDNDGNPLTMPLTFPQSPPAVGPVLGSTLDRMIKPNAQIVMESTGADSAPQLVGWGQLQSNGNIGGFGIFSNPTLGWNAVVPLETRTASRYILAFDNTGTLTTGVAIALIAGPAASIAVIIRDDAGTQIGNPTIPLAALGHTSFMLNHQYPVTVGKRGTVEFDAPAGSQISVLGLRAYGIAALTTLPVLADVGTGGGSITHVTYNGGFTSAIYLVNTGTTSASFTLNFFDESGSALAVPLVLPQTGTVTTTAALTQTLAAGATLVIETQAQDSLASVAGSAQLSTTGNVSGFEIFRWTTFNQEASVPLETRTPSSFVLLFDDTNGLTTGVALANQNATGANVTVNIYDDGGTLLQTASITLAGRGHSSFLLPGNYSVTSNKRGMVEFVVPQGGKISAVGLRAKADGTLTTIPVLTK